MGGQVAADYEGGRADLGRTCARVISVFLSREEGQKRF